MRFSRRCWGTPGAPNTAALANLGPLADEAFDAVKVHLGEEALMAALRPTPEALDGLVAKVDDELARFSESEAWHREGLITSHELGLSQWRAAVMVRLWREHGLTPARQAASDRLRNCAELLPPP